MIHMALSAAATLLGLEAMATDITFQGVSIDTRTLKPGNLFVALKGEQVDGHDFVELAREKGAAAALITEAVTTTLPTLRVTDAVLALGKLGTTWRQHFQLPLIAVTGSNGKTTLKNMIASIMRAACADDESAVLATRGTLNNHLGLPLTLARLSEAHRYAVIEMGMNHFGEIAYLSQLTKPTVAVITNAGACHLEGVGDIAGVARAKAEIFAGLAENGYAILNRDDDFFNFWQKNSGKHPCLTFGFDAKADVHVTLSAATRSQQLQVHTPAGDIAILLPLLGKHNVMNALAATAATLALGIDIAAIKKGLEQIEPAPGRLQLHTLDNGVNIIDDTYNANPFSLQAAIHTLASFVGKKIFVLGDMKELGNDAKKLHETAGTLMRQAGIDYLFTYGELTANTAQAFGEGAYHFHDQTKLVTALQPYLLNQMTILVKGSRSMHMEKVVTGLLTSH